MLWSLAVLPTAAGGVALLLRRASRLSLGTLACAAMTATLLAAVLGIVSGWTATLEWHGPLWLTASLTPLSASAAILVPVIALPILAYAAAHESEPGLSRLAGLMLVFVGGMELLIIADDLLTLLIGWEIVGACSWALIGHEWRDAENPRSGLYAFVTTRFGDLGLFVAAMATFAATGSFAYAGLAEMDTPYLEIAAFGILLSAAAKSGQVPFSPWLFRAMAGPTSVSALLHAAAMVAAGAYLLVRLEPYLGRADGFSTAVLLIGLATAISGGVVTVLQNHAKRLLAASTSAHFGLMFVAVGAGYPGVALLHLVAHAAFKALLFLTAGIAGERAESYALDRMGFGRALPVLTALSGIGALALAGVPPLGGGWTKEAVVSAAGHASAWAAGGVILAGALSAAYAVRFQLLAYGLADRRAETDAPSGAEYAGILALALLSLALTGLWVPPLLHSVGHALQAEIPQFKLPEFLASLAFLAIGLLGGWLLARRRSSLGSRGWSAAWSNWLGLPEAIRRLVVLPFMRLADAAAALDERAVDAGIRAAAAFAIRLAGRAASLDERAVDGGVRATGAFAAWAAGIGDRLGEPLAEIIPEGPAWLAGRSGAGARRLQTGLSHHYYALLAIGAAVAVAVLFIGL